MFEIEEKENRKEESIKVAYDILQWRSFMKRIEELKQKFFGGDHF